MTHNKHPKYEPTEEEIKERAAEVRKKWSDREIIKRLGLVVVDYTVPCVDDTGIELE